MSVINQMLRDLEQRQQGQEGSAIYVAPARRQGWWMLALTLLCGLALGILGWRSWIYWQQLHRAPQEASAAQGAAPDAIARAAPVAIAPAPQAVALPVPAAGAPVAPARQEESVADDAAPDDAPAQDEPLPEETSDEAEPSDEALQPDLQAELAAEQAAAAPPRKPGVLKIETVELSAAELAALAERKATTAMAKGQLREAQDSYYEVLAQDPHNQGAREQLAALLYGEARLSEASQLLEEGLRLDPGRADFRLLLARLALAAGDKNKALSWLAGDRPDLAANQDYYATWAGLAQDLGQPAQAAELYVKLLHQRPDRGLWWLGLGVAEDAQGHHPQALDAYRNAQLHGNLGEASAQWLAQRLAQLAP